MRIVLVPMGSTGDVHPFVGLGIALRARGYQTTFVANPVFASMATPAADEFVPLGTEAEYQAIVANPDLWSAHRALGVVMDAVSQATPRLYAVLGALHDTGEILVVAGGLAFGARIAQEKLGIPLVTIQLQPASFRSRYETAVMHPWLRWIGRLPPAVKGPLFAAIDHQIDRTAGVPVNQFRSEIGLPPAHRIMNDWWHSPQRVVGLFPDWFGAPQPDWPPQLTLTGFPLYDEGPGNPPVPGLDRFLKAGDPPIVFTPGSAMQHAHRFFETAVGATIALGMRAVLLTRHPAQLPATLPNTVAHFPFVPLSRLLPGCAALVHHGGIGTLAQGLRAGIPQLVMPMAHDQHDNAARLVRLGVGRAIRPSRFKPPRVTAALRLLVGSPAVAARCRDVAARLVAPRPVEETCDIIEELAGGGRPPDRRAFTERSLSGLPG